MSLLFLHGRGGALGAELLCGGSGVLGFGGRVRGIRMMEEELEMGGG